MTGKIQWRCFHCGDEFTLAQKKHAAAHFGMDESKTPVCLMRCDGEYGLLSNLRRAETELEHWRSEAMPIIIAMDGMKADHRQALIREEERGYNKGVQDCKLSSATEARMLELARLRNQAVTEGNTFDEQYYADALAVLVIETFGEKP